MKEWDEVQILFAAKESDAEEICTNRTKYALKWYIKKAILNKWIFYILTSISIASPLLSTVLVQVCKDGKELVTVILAAMTTLATSVLAMTNARMKWDNYRSAAEFLKTEYTLFQARVEPYNGEDRTSVYLNKIEDSMKQTHSKWEKRFQGTEKIPEKNKTESIDDKDPDKGR